MPQDFGNGTGAKMTLALLSDESHGRLVMSTSTNAEEVYVDPDAPLALTVAE